MTRHRALVEASRVHAARALRALTRDTGIPAEGHFLVIADLRGHLGRMIGCWVVGEAMVIARLAGTKMPPVIAIPLTREEGLAVMEELFPDLAIRAGTDSPGRIPAVVVDHEDVAVVIDVDPAALCAEA